MRMRRSWIPFTLWAALGIATGCGGGAAETVVGAVDAWEIEAAAPTIAGATVVGSFTAQGDGMRAYGGCLVTDLHGQKPCVTAADCATGAVVAADGHFEYCIAPAGETQKTCWTRNGADTDWCNKVPPPGRVAGTFATPSDGPRPPCASDDLAAAADKAAERHHERHRAVTPRFVLVITSTWFGVSAARGARRRPRTGSPPRAVRASETCR